MPSPERVRSGEPWQPSATTHNAFVDAWEYVEQLRRSGGAGTGRSVWGTNVVQVKNASGGDRDRFDVLGVDGPVISPADNLPAFKNRVVLNGVTPARPTHEGRFVVLLQPLQSGAIGWASVAGVTVAKVDFTAGVYSFADVKDGDAASLEAAPAGAARILWPTTGSGVEWAVVRLGDVPLMLCLGLVNGAVEAFGNTFAVDGVQVLSPPGAILDPQPTEAVNILRFPAEDNVPVLLVYDKPNDRWLGLPALYSISCINPCSPAT
jgi:hypothetical protein